MTRQHPVGGRLLPTYGALNKNVSKDSAGRIKIYGGKLQEKALEGTIPYDTLDTGGWLCCGNTSNGLSIISNV